MIIDNNRILDEDGRTLILRGVNLGGSSKSPFGPPGSSFRPESLQNPAEVSFVGRPFPLEEAESHFERLSRAGLTFLRFVITWEALEHAGPGIYDEAYLAYLRKILIMAAEKGIAVFIDPHQDVWSRWTGGDGAPAWTLEKLGMDLTKLDTTGAVITHQHYSEFHQGAPYPRMMWPSNYNRYAAATMFSLFFGGKTYAPDLYIDGKNVQDWLQDHYFAALRHCYRRLKNCGAIAGWGVMNEPHNGFIAHQNLEQTENPVMPLGPRPSPWDAIRAASGYTVKVPVYNNFGKRSFKSEIFNPNAQSLFKEGAICPWKQAGVWADDGGKPYLIRKDHFAQYAGRQAHFITDFHKPFTLRYIAAMQEADEKTFFFIEGIPGSGDKAHLTWEKNDPPNVINAAHWYDGFALFTKRFQPWFTVNPANAQVIIGKKKVQNHFSNSLAGGITWAREKMNNMPCLLGEFGLAFDMNNRRAFTTGDYSLHEEALTMYYNAVDANLLHSTLWNYTADNTNAAGDNWNDEDLSIFSEGKERAVAGWKRPYPMATAGEPLAIKWDYKQGIFHYRFKADSTITAPTIIYLPAEFFGPKTSITTPLRFEFKPEDQRLLVYNDGFGGESEVTVTLF
ncbi:MAG: cellulase family glycosylhydrolase [Treponema sp.]|nr:cellulase family glycosylhydrolase [Treponema sp.]